VDGINESNPSAALKFFVDMGEARNLLFQIDFKNQQGMNFFPEGKHFTTHPEPFDESDMCSRQTIVRKMKDGSFQPFATGTGDFAEVHQDGSMVDFEIFPWELQLRVNHSAVPQYQEGVDQMDYLKSITASSEPIFSVWARAEPPSGDEDASEEHYQEIGRIHLTSDMTGSLFGDTRLFFRHEPFNRDVNRLSNRGDSTRAKAWRKAEWARMPYSLGNGWGDTEVPDMGADAMATVETGIQVAGCPFAWLLA